MYSLLLCKYLSIPPTKLSAIVTAILAIEPATFPAFKAIEFKNLFADATTFLSVKISFKVFPMFSKCFLIEAMRFSLSPKPITNPFLNKFASSLNLFINPFNLSSILSIAVSPFASSPKFIFVGAISGTVLLFPELSSESSSLSLGSESLLI